MSDNKTVATQGPQIMDRMMDPGATREWAISLGVTEVDLRKAVAAVGTSEVAVRQYFATPAGVRLSSSGAVLGRPDREHGAYGMVKAKAGGEAPSLDERAIRGLGPNRLPVDKH